MYKSFFISLGWLLTFVLSAIVYDRGRFDGLLLLLFFALIAMLVLTARNNSTQDER